MEIQLPCATGYASEMQDWLSMTNTITTQVRWVPCSHAVGGVAGVKLLLVARQVLK